MASCAALSFSAFALNFCSICAVSVSFRQRPRSRSCRVTSRTYCTRGTWSARGLIRHGRRGVLARRLRNFVGKIRDFSSRGSSVGGVSTSRYRTAKVAREKFATTFVAAKGERVFRSANRQRRACRWSIASFTPVH